MNTIEGVPTARGFERISVLGRLNEAYWSWFRQERGMRKSRKFYRAMVIPMFLSGLVEILLYFTFRGVFAVFFRALVLIGRGVLTLALKATK